MHSSSSTNLLVSSQNRNNLFSILHDPLVCAPTPFPSWGLFLPTSPATHPSIPPGITPDTTYPTTHWSRFTSEPVTCGGRQQSQSVTEGRSTYEFLCSSGIHLFSRLGGALSVTGDFDRGPEILRESQVQYRYLLASRQNLQRVLRHFNILDNPIKDRLLVFNRHARWDSFLGWWTFKSPTRFRSGPASHRPCKILTHPSTLRYTRWPIHKPFTPDGGYLLRVVSKSDVLRTPLSTRPAGLQLPLRHTLAWSSQTQGGTNHCTPMNRVLQEWLCPSRTIREASGQKDHRRISPDLPPLAE